MNLLTLVRASLRHQRLANLLHVLLLALGVALIASLLLVAGQVGGRFERDARGVDMVIGAKGSPLQLILSSVYHLDIPTGNIPLAEAERWARHPMVAQAIPISLGDSVRGLRIVGTTPALLQQYQARLLAGRVWEKPMDAVIGSEAARAGLKLGDEFAGVHGLGRGGHQHGEHRYRVVGVLAPTGSVADRLVFTSLESVWLIHESPHHHDADDDDDDDHDEAARAEPKHREITAMLLRYSTPLAAAGFPRMVNTQSNLQAAVPAFETARVLQMIGLGLETLRAFALALIAAAALSLFIALYSAMETRRYDLAVLRSLGASRLRIVGLLWVEALLLSLVGTLLGVALGHAAVELLAHAGSAAGGVGLSGFAWIDAEWLLLAVPLLVGSLAALIPAWRAYRADVSTILSGA